MTVNKQVVNEFYITRLKVTLSNIHTSLSLDSVKHTKVESSLASPADMTKRAVSTIIHEDGLSGKSTQHETGWQNLTDDSIHDITEIYFIENWSFISTTMIKTCWYQACGWGWAAEWSGRREWSGGCGADTAESQYSHQSPRRNSPSHNCCTTPGKEDISVFGPFQQLCLHLEIKMHVFILKEDGEKTCYSHVRPVGGRSVTPFLLEVSVPAGHDIKKIEVHFALINTAISVSGQHTFKTIKRLLRQYLWILIFCLVVKSWRSFFRQHN